MSTASGRLVVLAVMAVASAGCASKPPSATPAAPSSPALGEKAPGEARVGDRTRCPVTGDSFTVTSASPRAEHRGKTYYFCCPGCDKEFQANPVKYVHST